MLLSRAVARVMTSLPCCCHGFALIFGVCCLSLLPHSYSVIAVGCFVFFCFAVSGCCVAEQAHFDLYMTSAPVGHHVPLQPLVTGSHLHPSPASSPPSSSSPSTLPSSSQSSVTGPPRFSFSYPLFPHDFLFSRGDSGVCKCFHFILSLLFNWLCICVCSGVFCVSQSFYLHINS